MFSLAAFVSCNRTNQKPLAIILCLFFLTVTLMLIDANVA